ncbi:MAG: NADH:flavin oxidoreductase, Old Yellow Enzyme f amily [Frankiales bacterium]|nr:NADH:flavin oxidoreductase, Old Yellow Enzyme f amily [Frankiales bacterium]
MSKLFAPLTLRGTEFRNRVFVSPMCQYSALEGVPEDWHLVHLGARAVGGAGLVLTEATGISPEGRISPQDTGIWSERHVEQWARITAFVKSQGAVAGIQLAHAGRKASTYRPWEPKTGTVPADEGGCTAVAPSAIAFGGYAVPQALDAVGIVKVITDFVAAAGRAKEAGFDVVEIHAGHGYLLHQFLSPLSNTRTDEYGGSFDNRVRLLLEVVEQVRATWEGPVFVRLSATDWTEGGWTLEESVRLAPLLAAGGVDLVDTTSGGLHHQQRVVLEPGYQAPFAEAVRRAGIATGAVGLITEPKQAEEVLASEQADVVLLARELLRDPHWPLRAAAELGAEIGWPVQYQRARP